MSPSRLAYLYCAKACTLDGTHVTGQVLQVLLVTCRRVEVCGQHRNQRREDVGKVCTT